MQLEQIDQETCVRRIRALKSRVLTDEEERCRNCNREYELSCNRYLPVSRTELAFRKGYNAVLSNQIKEETFEDMFTIHSGGFI